MLKEIKITIWNRLILEKRDINIYHHCGRSAHILSHDCSVTLPLQLVIEDDYLHISIVSGPGCLEEICLVNLPSWMDFELSAAGDAIVSHSDQRIILKIPPGPPVWQLKITRSVNSHFKQSKDFLIVGDDRPENL